MEKEIKRSLEEKGTPFECWVWRLKVDNVKIFWPKHHPSKPAVRYKSGGWEWWWMGRKHRLDGPSDYIKGRYFWFIGGQQLTYEEWNSHPQRLEWLKKRLVAV